MLQISSKDFDLGMRGRWGKAWEKSGLGRALKEKE